MYDWIPRTRVLDPLHADPGPGFEIYADPGPGFKLVTQICVSFGEKG